MWVVGVGRRFQALVALAHDYSASHIQDATKPDKAFRRFFMAVRTRRSGKAYASLVPAARRAGPVDTVKIKNIPPNTGNYSITNTAGFAKYWRSVFKGPSSQARGVQLKRARTVKETRDGLALVEVEYVFTSYPSLVMLTLFLLGPILCLILILIVRKKTPVKIRKLLIKCRGKWYLAEGEFQGPLDRVKLGKT